MFVKIITILSFSVFFGIITLAGMGASPGISLLSFIHDIPFGDKFVHFGILLTFTFLLNESLKGITFHFKARHFLTGSLIILIFFTVEEFSQLFIPHRNFELMDLICNYAGIAAGSYLYLWGKQKKIRSLWALQFK